MVACSGEKMVSEHLKKTSEIANSELALLRTNFALDFSLAQTPVVAACVQAEVEIPPRKRGRCELR